MNALKYFEDDIFNAFIQNLKKSSMITFYFQHFQVK